MTDSLLSALNPAQQEAVTNTSANTLVLAGAGSGKTRVLVYRIAWLVQEQDVSPFSILAVTFTNKAATEMRQRAERLLNFPISGMWIGTFHGLAHRLLRAHWQEAHLPETFQIIDSEDQLQLIRRIMRQLELAEENWPAKQAQWFINHKKDEGLRPAQLGKPQDLFTQTMLRIYQIYEDRCQQAGLVDFAELLLRAYELWQQQPHILSHYQQRFSHILVDEFQDTNTIQYNWIKLLANPETHVTVVGDDDQSIYSWRGARIENIHHFQKDFSCTQVIRLEQNYRSTSNILNAANSIIANNDDRLGKTLWTDIGEGEPIHIYSAYNDLDEARFMVSHIMQCAQQGQTYNEFAILYRSNAQSRVIEEALIQMRVPYRVYGGLRFFERAEIKDALAYLNLIANRDNDAAFERAVNTPTRGIGQATLTQLRQTVQTQHVSLWQAAKYLIEKQILSARACNALSNFMTLIDELAESTKALNLDETVEHMLHYSSLLSYYQKIKTEKGQVKVENLEELINAAGQFETSQDDAPSLATFLSHVTLETGENQADPNVDHVQLMTLHAAKGLEFPVVFLSGLEEGLFPHQMSMDEIGGLEEERRLCYVGMTRAKQKLYISHAEIRRLHGQEKYQRPSRFIREIPKQYIQTLGQKVKVSEPISFKSNRQKKSGGLQLGQSVLHKTFGEGLIINIEGSGPRARLQVKFKDVGTKWLVAEFAKLEPA